MAVTNAQIRDLLNRPRGLNDGTITEYITIRTNEITKSARSATLYAPADAAVTDALKDDAVKYLVACDCLRVLIDTVPSYVPENEFSQQDIRFRAQLNDMRKQADKLVKAITEKGGTAFATDQTVTRQETT